MVRAEELGAELKDLQGELGMGTAVAEAEKPPVAEAPATESLEGVAEEIRALPETPAVAAIEGGVEDVRPDLEAAKFAAGASMPSTIDRLGEEGADLEAEEDIKESNAELLLIAKQLATAEQPEARRDLLNQEILVRTAKLARLEALKKSGALIKKLGAKFAQSYETDAIVERTAIDEAARRIKTLESGGVTKKEVSPVEAAANRLGSLDAPSAKREPIATQNGRGIGAFLREAFTKPRTFLGNLRKGFGNIADDAKGIYRRRAAEANPPATGGTTEVPRPSKGIEVTLPKEAPAVPESSRLVGLAEDFRSENLSRGVIDELFQAGGTISFNQLLDTLDRQGQISGNDQKAKANRLLQAMNYLAKRGIVSGKGPTYKIAISEEAWKKAAAQLETTGAIVPKSRRGERPLRAGEEAMPEFIAADGEDIPAGYVRAGDQPVPVPKAPSERQFGPLQDIPRPKIAADKVAAPAEEMPEVPAAVAAEPQETVPAAKIESKFSANENAAMDFAADLDKVMTEDFDDSWNVDTLEAALEDKLNVAKFGDRTDKTEIAKVMNRIMFQEAQDSDNPPEARRALANLLERRGYVKVEVLGPDKLRMKRLEERSDAFKDAQAQAKTAKGKAEAADDSVLRALEEDEKLP